MQTIASWLHYLCRQQVPGLHYLCRQKVPISKMYADTIVSWYSLFMQTIGSSISHYLCREQAPSPAIYVDNRFLDLHYLCRKQIPFPTIYAENRFLSLQNLCKITSLLSPLFMQTIGSWPHYLYREQVARPLQFTNIIGSWTCTMQKIGSWPHNLCREQVPGPAIYADNRFLAA